MTVATPEPHDGPLAHVQHTMWAEIVERWASRQRSTNTQDAYRRDAHQWAAWCAPYNPLDARFTAAEEWRGHLTQTYAPATVARKMAALSSLYAYIGDLAKADGHLPPLNPFDVDRPNIDPDHSDTIALDEKQAAMLVHAAAAEGPQAQMIVEILLTTGIRSAELLHADVTDLRMDHAVPTLTITRKGGTRGRVTLDPRVWELARTVIGDRDEGPIVTGAGGQPMDHTTLYRLIKRIACRSDLDDDTARRLSPHCLRASFATINFDNSTPQADIQDAMGHKDPRTTRRYDRGRGRLHRLARATSTVANFALKGRPDPVEATDA